MAMLKQYGPGVPHNILEMLVAAFSELREMADRGQIAYPYSTREVVNIVKHLQVYPEDGVGQVVRNVFDFDSYHPDVQNTILSTLRKHGIPVGVSMEDVKLTKEFPLPKPNLIFHWTLMDNKDVICPVTKHSLVFEKPIRIECPQFEIERKNARSTGFNELLTEWMLPLYESSVIMDLAVGEGDISGDWLHVATANPLVIFSMQTNQNNVVCSDLYPLFPYNYFNQSPAIEIVALNGDFYRGRLIFLEQHSNTLLLLNPAKGELQQIFPNDVSFTKSISRRLKQTKHELRHETMLGNRVVLFPEDGTDIQMINFDAGSAYTISLPFSIDQLHLVSEQMWILREKNTETMYFLSSYQDSNVPLMLTPVKTDDLPEKKRFIINSISAPSLPQDIVKNNRNNFPKVASCDSRFTAVRLVAGSDLATLAISDPAKILQRQSVSFYSYQRNLQDEKDEQLPVENFSDPICLPKLGQVVRVVPHSLLPPRDENKASENAKSKGDSLTNYLEVVDVGRNNFRYLALPQIKQKNLLTKWKGKEAFIGSLSNNLLVSVTSDGFVGFWETCSSDLLKSFSEWKTLVGSNNDIGSSQVTYERHSGLGVSQPKHGEIDPNNEPHVGGNTWAGGTGGRDTAGLGGKGGPYRLDAGHDVFQVSQQEKDAVPDEVKRAAKEMGQKAFKERLQQIEMSEYEAEIYEKFSSRVHRQIQSLRVLLESLQAKGKERHWVRHQISGDLDDGKLIEGLTGEKTIYKKRTDQEPELGSRQQVPKLLRLVVDVSGSMYRFNGVDGRLERVMEAACLVMEAFNKHEQRFKYDIVGHSGENSEIFFTSQDRPPANNKQRLQVLQTMHAHAQFCMSGDNTVEASQKAIQSITQREADEYFVVIFSDANLRRYGISTSALADTLMSNPRVNAFIIFIGSLGNEAASLSKKLPSGRSFVCMDTKNIPEILQQIFSSAMMLY